MLYTNFHGNWIENEFFETVSVIIFIPDICGKKIYNTKFQKYCFENVTCE